ncbi:MAG TPA: serine/threonine-protein kinase [Thermoanaerobaculia bacterium]|jgi:tetratricopeptide (TPR) repeat protein/predicted Ser/Thr protein kinase|nr:serine/threonine-protein kinase [Thermoanaerobaculia bacterium]
MSDGSQGLGERPSDEASTETFFLGKIPPPQISPLRERDLGRGATVGRYVILDCIGTGGMGVVYSAYDPELDRKVALKLLRPDRGSSSGEAGRLRLLREAQAIARLSHPNVIAVYDTGSLGDQVFVAMEFVEGWTLRQWLEEKRPAWREVLARFVLAGRGLAAAHAAGLVHRDFKPDNVLLGKDGRVRVVDFGLARPVEKLEAAAEGGDPLSGSGGILGSPLTEGGVALGTPAYMAPEQLRGASADARSDQFSFCVSLYEALYGERPFPGTTTGEMLAAVKGGTVREEPAGVRVPGRLRTALLRGLSADPGQRYPSIEKLLRDLEHDPVVVRRRWLAAAAVLFVTGALFSSLGYFQARRTRLCSGAEEKVAGVWNGARRQAVRAAFLATGVPVADATWSTVEHALDHYTTDWAVMRREACEATRLRGEQSEDLLDRRMFCLDQRLQETAAMLDLFARADRQVMEKAVVTAAGLPPLETCADVRALTAKMPPPRDPGLRARVEAVRAQVAEARVLTRTGKLQEALAAAQAAVAQAGRLDYSPIHAEALYQKGFDLDQTGDTHGAEETLFDAFVAAQEANHQEVAARAASQLAWTTGWIQARTAEGHRWSRLAMAIAEGARSGDALRAELFQQLGGVLANERRYTEATDVSLKALALYERALGRDHVRLAPVLNNLGEIFNQMGQYEKALGFSLRGLEIRKKKLEPDHPDFNRSYSTLGNIYSNLNRDQEAAIAFERSLAISERHYGPNHWLTAGAYGNLATAYQNLGRLAEALRYNQQALASFEACCGGPESQYTATVLVNMGEVLRLQKKSDESLATCRKALAIQEKVLGPEHPDLSFSLVGVAKALLDLGRAKEAVPAAERAVALLEGKPLDPRFLQEARFTLAQALWSSDHDHAVRLALQAREGFSAAGHLDLQRQVETWLRQRGQTW